MDNQIRLKIVVVLVLHCIHLQCQVFLKIQVIDIFKNPIPYVVFKNENKQYSGDRLGYYTIKNYRIGSKIEIHKLGFADTIISLKNCLADTLTTAVILHLNPTNLPEITVSNSFINEINPVRGDFILGYELHGDYLLEVLSNNIVVLTNAENSLISRTEISEGVTNIVKDSYDKLYLLNKEIGFKFWIDSAAFVLDSIPLGIQKIEWRLKYCEAEVDTAIYLRRFKDNNQTVAFFAVSKSNPNHVKLLKEITDKERKRAVKSFADESYSLNRYLVDMDINMMNAANGEELDMVLKAKRMSDMFDMNYSPPSYSVLRMINDTIYIFAHDIDSMLVYDNSWNLIKSKPIFYHHLKFWAKELIVNEEHTSVYAKFITSGKCTLTEIDLQTGQLKPVSSTFEARFPKNIKIRGKTIYFMAKGKNSPGNSVFAIKNN